MYGIPGNLSLHHELGPQELLLILLLEDKKLQFYVSTDFRQ
ncbi:hypothetical protein SynMITS9220_02382 [Synechococcus sp. MIT S9220]|nr:hypothetical protein SynMITS9220_02382 [Synechococcus sp. MIT S9220]